MAVERGYLDEEKSIWKNKFVKTAVIVIAVAVGIGVTLELLS